MVLYSNIKKIEYILLVKRFVRSEKRVYQYALVKLHFMKSNDLQVEANSRSLIIDARTLRLYFGIDYSDNMGDIIRQFTKQLGNIIPKMVPDIVSDIERKAMRIKPNYYENHCLNFFIMNQMLVFAILLNNQWEMMI